MKLSTILLSINLAATIPLAANQVALAAETGKAEAGDWLKSSLSAVNKKSGLKAAPARKLSLSDSSVDASDAAFSKYVAGLKPIDPRKKLPSKRELELKLMARTPVMAQAENRTLSGQISLYQDGSPSQASTYAAPSHPASSVSAPESLRFAQHAAKSAMQKVSHQAIAGNHRIGSAPSVQNMMKAAQSAISHAQTQHAHAQMQHSYAQTQHSQNGPAHVANQSLDSRMSDWLGESKLEPGERVIGQAGTMLVQAPVLNPQIPPLTDAELMRQMQQASAEQHIPDPTLLVPSSQPNQMMAQPQMTAYPGQMTAMPAHASAGPPPFPLNLIPEPQLKEFIRGGSARHAHAPRAYFGSWHGQSQLPKAGFRSNMTGKSNFTHYVKASGGSRPSNRYANRSTRNVSVSASTAPRPSSYRPDSRKAPQGGLPVKTASAKMATYGPYVSQNSVTF